MGLIDAMRGEGFAARTISDGVVVETIQTLRVDEQGRPTPESLYGRRKMTGLERDSARSGAPHHDPGQGRGAGR